MRKRQNRLSTISSDFFEGDAYGNESPRASMRQRRKSSNFDMLCDPFKYQDYVKQFLDGIDEEEDQYVNSQPNRASFRKRTKSSNFLAGLAANGQTTGTTLHEIDEETYDNNQY